MITLIAKMMHNRYKKKLNEPVKEKTYHGNIPKPPIARKRKRKGFEDFETFSHSLME